MTNNSLPRTTPESQGISSAALLAFVDALAGVPEIHSLMVLRHGSVVAEGWWSPYAAARPHMLFSLSKSFTSSAIGLAVAEGRLSVDDLLLSFFPDEAPLYPDANLAAMRIRHLLSMSTGHDQDTTGRLHANPDGDWVRAFLALPVEHVPGTHFVYNSGATYMLSAVVQKLTGMQLVEYLTPRLFEPLGIENPTWETSAQGINFGGWGLSIKTEDIARFGQMYLQKGVYAGKRILSEAWVAEATSKQVKNGTKPDSDWEQGYGYQIWRCQHGAYRGDGAYGQYCVVMPAQDAVLAITSRVDDMQAVLNVAWQHLLPAFGAQPLPENPAVQARLAGKLSGLALTPAQGQALTPAAAAISGKTFLLESNPMQIEAIRFDFAVSGSTVKVRFPDGEQLIRAGCGDWVAGMMTAGGPGPRPVAASGVWTAADTFELTLRYYETPFHDTYAFQFDGGNLLLKGDVSVVFMPNEHPQAKGRVVR
jgi:CubicO group peptidase (beta-lactamase class C family)